MLIIDTDRFISMMESRPVLYDTQHPLYKDYRRKKAIWEELAQSLAPDWEKMDSSRRSDAVKSLKKLWRSLRDSFACELKQQREESRSGAGSSSRTVYQHFHALQFLRPVVELRQSETSLDQVPSIEEEQQSEEGVLDSPGQDGNTQQSTPVEEETLLEDGDTEIIISTPSTSTAVDAQSSTSVTTHPTTPGSSLSNRGRGRKRVRSLLGLLQHQSDQFTTILQSLVVQQQDRRGPYYHFGLSVAQMLGDLPRERVLAIQHRICNVIFEEIAEYQRELRFQATPPPPPQINWGYPTATVPQHSSAWRAPPPSSSPTSSSPTWRLPVLPAPPVTLPLSISSQHQEDEEGQTTFFAL